jgi:hypothetical protein
MSRRFEYEIWHDYGFYIACDGHNLCGTYRFSKYEDALKRLREWEAEDEEARLEVEADCHEPPSVRWEDA